MNFYAAVTNSIQEQDKDMSNYIDLGTTTSDAIIYFPVGFTYTPVNLQSNERTLDGSMITNYTVTSGGNRVTKRRWDVSGVRTFLSSFAGATGSSCSVNCLGVTYASKIISQSYRVIATNQTGEHVIQYSITVEET